MTWPPRIAQGALDGIAARAVSLQRRAFLKLLDVEKALVPLDPEHKLDPKVVTRVKADLEIAADALIDGNSASTLLHECG